MGSLTASGQVHGAQSLQGAYMGSLAGAMELPLRPRAEVTPWGGPEVWLADGAGRREQTQISLHPPTQI